VSIQNPAGPGPDVTVVIITHNRPDYLRSALWGLSEQRGTPPRVIVVDDASSPPAEIAGFEELDVQLLRNDPGRGAPGARNRGLEEVTTPWVAFLDDDDVFLPGHLEGVRAAIAGAPSEKVGFVYSGAIVTDPDRRVLGIIPAYPQDDLARALYGGAKVPTPSAAVIRTAAVRGVGGFDTTLMAYADWDMWLRLTRAGWTAVATAEASLIYTRHTQSMTVQIDMGLTDLRLMLDRYGADAARLGVRQPDEGYDSHMGMTLLAGGQRGPAARAYLRSFAVRRKARDLVLAAMALVGHRPPHWMRRVHGIPAEFPGWVRRLRRFESGDAVAR
jgi:glycosyltransferase involved in cell wall biosynthesis